MSARRSRCSRASPAKRPKKSSSWSRIRRRRRRPDPGRYGAHHRQRSRYPAGDDCTAEGSRFRHRHAIYELPVKLDRAFPVKSEPGITSQEPATGEQVSTQAIATAKEVFDLLRDDLLAIETRVGARLRLQCQRHHRDQRLPARRRWKAHSAFAAAAGGAVVSATTAAVWPGSAPLSKWCTPQPWSTTTLLTKQIPGAADLRPTQPGVIQNACWRATGCICRPSASLLKSAICRFSTC